MQACTSMEGDMAKASWDMIPFARWIGGAAGLAAMLLGLGSAADAKDCTRATPPPIDTTITAPAGGVPAGPAPFSGPGGGGWTTRPGRGGPCGAPGAEG